MNILPKKRWHVRTKENIARVRKDEAEAAEKERQEKLRIENADREVRLNILKNKSKEKLEALGIDTQKKEVLDETWSSGHINLFTDIDHAVKNTNKEHEKEKKENAEEYEKKIGYLTYLGQDTNEALKKKNWYEVSPKCRLSETSSVRDTYEKLVLKDQDGKPVNKQEDVLNGEKDWKLKQRHDPINKFIKYCKGRTDSKSKESSIKTKHNNTIKTKKIKDNRSKECNLDKLRAARLKREQQEKCRTKMFLSNLHNTSKIETKTISNVSKIVPKYNSQYNPEFARQNYK